MSGWGDRSLDNQETNSWTTFAKKASRSNNNHQDSYQQNRGRGQGMPQRGRGRGRGGYYGDRSQQYNNNQRQGSWNNNQQRDNNNWSSTRNDNNSQSQDQSWSNNNTQQDTQRNGWGSNSQSSANNNNQESNSWGSNSYEAKPTTTSNNWGNDNVEASNGWGNNKTATSNTAGAWGSDSQKPAFTPSNNNASGGWGAAAATKPATNQWAQPPAPATTNSSTNQWGESSTPAATNQWNQSTTPAASTNQWNQSSAPAAEPQSSAGEGWDDKPQSKDVQWGAVSLDDLGWNEKNKKSSLELSQGIWKDGRHILGEDNETLRLKLFGTLEDKENVHSGINFDKYDNIPVETKGDNVPEGITEFSNSGMDKHLLENIEMAHFKVPTPVQKHSIPIVMNGHGLMACAQTGSGKTAGFLFPILSAMFSNGPLEDPKEAPIKKGYQFYKKSYPQALILAPTRELASQIYKEAKKFCYRSYVRPCVAYGGADIGAQLRLIDRGCHILIATPGRLVDILERRRISFKNIQYLVLDEADRMLDMGFEPQVRRIVEGEDMPPATGRQTLMFSATFPEKIQRLARDFMASYVFLSVGRVGGTSDNITQEILWVKEEEKKKHLIEALENKKENQGLTLVFTQTKRMADSVCRFLNERNFPATAIHGDRIQSEREEALASFKKGITPIMVATAVAARGLDIPNVTHVISFDLPSDIDDYVHRIGRTGRAGNTGFATTFFASGDRFLAADLIKLLKDANQTVPSWLEEISREARSF